MGAAVIGVGACDERRCGMRIVRLGLALLLSGLVACTTTAPPIDGKVVPQNVDTGMLGQLAKTDMDRLADIEMNENTASLRRLMLKLYKRNPREWKKSDAASAEERVSAIFDGRTDWRMTELNGEQEIAAIHQSFRPDYAGDRVLSLIVGLQTMLIKAHGGKSEFYLTDSIDPQSLYNVARNVEIAVWKLSNARDEQGQLLLLTNEITETDRNLSFEREFGKIVGRLDLMAATLAEKSNRKLVQAVQTMASALFLPF